MKRKPAKPARLTATPFPADARKAAVSELAHLRMRVTALEDRPYLDPAACPLWKHEARLAALEAPRPSIWRRLARIWP